MVKTKNPCRHNRALLFDGSDSFRVATCRYSVMATRILGVLYCDHELASRWRYS